jgi:hypothetical protein
LVGLVSWSFGRLVGWSVVFWGFVIYWPGMICGAFINPSIFKYRISTLQSYLI